MTRRRLRVIADFLQALQGFNIIDIFHVEKHTRSNPNPNPNPNPKP